MNASVSSLAARTRRSIYIPLAALAAAIAIAGFWRTYFGPLFAGTSRSDWLAHVHAAVFMGWIVLVGLQAYLAIRGRTALHMKIGRFGMAYGLALIVVGLGFSVVMVTRKIAADGVDSIPGAFLVPLTDMGVFAIFLGGAWFMRRRSEYHRRFILLATTTILIAAVGRMFGGTRSVAPGDVLPFLAVWLLPVWIAMLHDWFRSRTVHVVYMFGALLLIALRYRQVVRETDAWTAFSRRLLQWIADHLT